MLHRISAGVIVEADSKILLVHNYLPGRYDFWVAPGGGVEGAEDLQSAALREVREECGLDVELGPIAYIEDLYNPEQRICKIWFIGHVIGGAIRTDSAEASAEGIVAAAFLSRKEFEGKVVFPLVLESDYWRDRESGFNQPRYLGIREMEVY